MKRHRQKPNEEYNFWQPATDMMSGLVFVLVLIIALLGLYLLSDYTGYEEASSVSSEGPSSSGTGWNNNDPGGWYYDGGTGEQDGRLERYHVQVILHGNPFERFEIHVVLLPFAHFERHGVEGREHLWQQAGRDGAQQAVGVDHHGVAREDGHVLPPFGICLLYTSPSPRD